MQLAHGYTEETEDGITWRICRQPAPIIIVEENEDEIENEEIVEENEDTEHFWAFNPRQEVQEQLDHNVWRSLYKHPIQLNILIDVLCTETIEELDAIEECGICYEPVKLLDTALLGCCHQSQARGKKLHSEMLHLKLTLYDLNPKRLQLNLHWNLAPIY